MIFAAKIMTSTISALIEDPRKLKEAKDDFYSIVFKYIYIPIIPEDVLPTTFNNNF